MSVIPDLPEWGTSRCAMNGNNLQRISWPSLQGKPKGLIHFKQYGQLPLMIPSVICHRYLYLVITGRIVGGPYPATFFSLW